MMPEQPTGWTSSHRATRAAVELRDGDYAKVGSGLFLYPGEAGRDLVVTAPRVFARDKAAGTLTLLEFAPTVTFEDNVNKTGAPFGAGRRAGGTAA